MSKGLLRVALLLCLGATLHACGRHAAPTSPDALAATPPDPRAGSPSSATAAPIRAAYFYHYMNPWHLDSLAAAGFDRAMVKWIGDSLSAGAAGQLRAWVRRGGEVGVEIVPTWSLQARTRLGSLATRRRYTWGSGHVEPDVGCPLDSMFWEKAFLERAGEMLRESSRIRRLALDLEIYNGSRHHYDAGPCLCSACLREHRGRLGPGRDPVDREAFQEERLTKLLTAMLSRFAAAYPGVELGIFDLDFDSFVHRAMARALVRAHVTTVDYCERTYSTAAAGVPAARAALDALGVSAPLVGGLWLRRYSPESLAEAIAALRGSADGYFIFTSYSLWQDPARLSGPYVLQGSQSEYWAALRRANP